MSPDKRKRSVRVLVWQQHGQDDPRYYATSSGLSSIGTASGGYFKKHIIGYAEFPTNTRVEAKDSFEGFCEEVEGKAEYVHWKPRWHRALRSGEGDTE